MLKFSGLVLHAAASVQRRKQIARAQDALDKTVIKLLEEYTPISKKGGFTRASPRKWVVFKGRGRMSRAHRQEKPGVIINTEPKARKEYYINKGFSGAKRGKYWLETTKAERLPEIRDTVQEAVKNDNH